MATVKKSIKNFSELKNVVAINSTTDNDAEIEASPFKSVVFEYSIPNGSPTETEVNKVSDEDEKIDVTQNENRRNPLRWNAIYDDIFVNDKNNVSCKVHKDFNALLETVEDNYSLFIDGYFIYSYCGNINRKVRFKSMTSPPKVSDPVYYYMVSYGSSQKTYEFITKHVMKDPKIKCVFENINPPARITDRKEFSNFINLRTQKVITPVIITDMLSLLIDANETNTQISDVILFSNNSSLKSAIECLVSHDINVHLGLSRDIAVSIPMINSATSVFPLDSYFTQINGFID
jgi:predicted regulator of amino acid metabolism with ACT domain